MAYSTYKFAYIKDENGVKTVKVNFFSGNADGSRDAFIESVIYTNLPPLETFEATQAYFNVIMAARYPQHTPATVQIPSGDLGTESGDGLVQEDNSAIQI